MSAEGPAPASPAARIVEVAVGVIERADGQLLLAQRPPGRPYEGYWEFPGGKLEPGEPVEQALARELHEELGLTAVESVPWLVVEHAYPHATVRLYFRRVRRWEGEPRAREGQQLAWQPADHIGLQPLLPASLGPIRWLALPRVLAISCAASLPGGPPAFLERVRRRLQTQPAGSWWLLLREPDLAPAPLERLMADLLALRTHQGLRLLVSSRHPMAWARQADGVHLTARDLLAVTTRPASDWVGASCHDARELAAAAALGCDYALLSPVLPTASHPGMPTLGFDGLRQLTARTPLPVLALGGLDETHREAAAEAGAQGLAMMRGAWS